MFTETDYERLKQIMEESPEKKELLGRLLLSHQAELSSVSHELRNPLTLIYSAVQMIESRHPEVLSYSGWKPLRQDVEYMRQLLEELSHYNNGTRLSLSAIDTSDFLKSVVLSFAASLTDTDIEFTSRIEPGLPDISADPVKLREVLLNLLKNACDAVSGSAPKISSPSISLYARMEGESLHITVSDNGCGIRPEIAEEIFQPFITHKKNGTGLGLAIARRIAQAHGGSLTLSSASSARKMDSSKPGMGTRFTLSLPVQQNA